MVNLEKKFQWARKIPGLYAFFRSVYFRFIYKDKLVQRLTRHLDGRPEVFFVQIGSNDGVVFDPLRKLILKNTSWRGIFVEPVSFIFERLKANYDNDSRFIFENSAINSDGKPMEFYYVSPEAAKHIDLPEHGNLLGAFDREHIICNLGKVIEPYLVAETMNCLTLPGLLEKHAVKSFDVLHVDTEGYDLKILSQLDFARYKPEVILVEYICLEPADRVKMKNLLTDNGYVVYFGDDDYLAIRR